MIVPIVEGHSEVESIPLLMRRVGEKLMAYTVEIVRPIRVKRNKVVKPGEMEKAVDLAKRIYPQVRAIMFVIDADDDCPKELAPQLLNRASHAATNAITCSVVLPTRELESWFLASIKSLRGFSGIREDAIPPNDPETIRDAKGRLGQAMLGHCYVETIDQPSFAARFDLDQAYEKCRSFRKFDKDVKDILSKLAGADNA